MAEPTVSLRVTGSTVLLAVLLVATDGAQRPVIENELQVDFISPPDTVAEMVARADAVVIATHASAKPGVFVFEGARETDRGIPTTVHVFVVRDVVKAHPTLPIPGDELVLEVAGGERVHGAYVERTSVRGVRPIAQGRTYAIFLRWLAERERWDVPWGVGSAFYDVSTGGTVRSLAEAPGRHDQRSVSDFLVDLGVREIGPAAR